MTKAGGARTLPSEPAQARRFGRVRDAQATALLEDYVELIADLLADAGEARLVDIARRMGVAHPTAAKTINRLKRQGLAMSEPYRGVFLTEAGARMAERARVRHRLVVLVLETLGVPSEVAEADAEGMEHYISDVTERVFTQFVGRKGG
ncbi:MAG: transcriptional regulator MntR [Acidiphilium sp. 37-64-53]|uniref:manganese-binding transcriptional regulator MntR n=1 Tax=unclassified Acidiphilium TaxID=2617493 RepID=UPI000BD79C7E|nr:MULTISPECIES: manganese-binding transcriptional regulator MntR [unclassified Acidiphilium]OYV99556.1 MAG: transcriptional regulator MntR [Acidiphilium sp. 37-64-53]OZB21252.1 MAG: transcriptional regulator MntR [Acidiphilium sp. 34-64-41]